MSEETKPKVEGDDGVMSIKVKDPSGGEVVFKIKRHTKFGKVMEAFCNKKAWDSSQVRFVFDGERVFPDATPESLSMESGDCIDAFLEQIGGF